MKMIFFNLGTVIIGWMSLSSCDASKSTPQGVDTTPTSMNSAAESSVSNTSATSTGTSSTASSSSTTVTCSPTSKAPASSGRTGPRVFMALHGANALANDSSYDSQWTYVREHLDGIWGNNANLSSVEEAALWNKITTRTLITEWDSVDKKDFVSPALFGGSADVDPSIILKREAISLYTSTASDWNGTTIDDAKANYVTNSSVASNRRFYAVYTGWQPQNFQDAGLTGDALTAFNNASGVFLECGFDICLNEPLKTAFETAIKMAHAKNQIFIWFNGTTTDSNWMAKSQNEYNHLISSNLLLPTDVVMIINYGGSMTPVPEVDAGGNPANTVTGMLYWLLHQGSSTASTTAPPCTFVKPGNSGVLSCDTYCAASQYPGGTGTCQSAVLTTTNTTISCRTTPGFTTGGLTCTCIPDP